MILYLDIETAAGDGVKFIPTAEDMKAKSNLKDEEKIKRDIEAKRQGYRDKAALDWATGQVISVALCLVPEFAAEYGAEGDLAKYGVAGDLTIEIAFVFSQKRGASNQKEVDETRLLTLFSNAITGCTKTNSWKVVTFNGHKFDVPFLVGRMITRNVKIPPIGAFMDWSKRYPNPEHHLDLYQYLTRNEQITRWPGGATLDFWCKYFGVLHDELMSGKDVPALWLEYRDLGVRAARDLIIQHNLNDAKATRALHERLFGKQGKE